MRAYKTVNDSYIEPISFTVPRRAETFQSDIYPPATGTKPAMSAKEWFDGKTAIPSKIDLESVYEGNAPVEIVSDYKAPAAAPAPVQKKEPEPAPKKAPEPTPKKAPEPAPAPVRAPTTVADQKSSISAMANKYQDQEESSDDDDAETSSFEEIARPAPSTSVPVRFAAKPQPLVTSPPAAQAKPASPPKSPQATTPASRASPAVSPSFSSAVEAALQQIKQVLEQQAQVISDQSERITVQTQIITRLATEVETIKKRVGAGTQDQNERIRQLELELEEARS
jgi:coronin-1B/1C/6